jgi:hypothetical protein
VEASFTAKKRMTKRVFLTEVSKLYNLRIHLALEREQQIYCWLCPFPAVSAQMIARRLETAEFP